MKTYLLLVALLLTTLGLRAQSLMGKVIDSATGETIPGAVVYIPQLKLGATTDANGAFVISPIPKGTYDMEVEILGYATITKQVTIKDSGVCHCKCDMQTSCNSENEVIITALGNITDSRRSPTPVTLVSHEAMLQKTSSTVIDAIASQPGVNETSEGPGTTKPQINGLGFDRVLVLMDGVPQEDFQWGDDHGILIDPYAVYDAEIIRGPASLQYGASAEAGVISFKSEPFAENGTVQGSALAEYQTNNGLVGNSEDIGGNNKGFVWNLRASTEEAHCYRDPKDGFVWGTAWQQQNARFTIGLNKSWGYTRFYASALHRRIEVPDGNRDSATGMFMFDAPQNGKLYPTRADFMSYNADVASDKILNEYQTWWQNSINAGKGRIGLDVGFTRSEHHDIDTGTIGQGNMVVNDIPYSLKYQITGANSGLKFTTGVNGMYEFENNYPEPPAPYIGNFEIPDYTDFEIGGYAILEKDFKNLTLSGGIRYDMSNFIGQSMYLINSGTPQQQQVAEGTPGAEEQFAGFNNTYTGPSGSIGASYQLPGNNYVKLNLAKSFRAPAIDELTSNGLNIGTKKFQLGNLNLKPEEGYEADFAYGNNGKNLSYEADAFCNYINNFIFADRTDSSLSGFPVYPTIANTAIIGGVSGYFNIHPVNTKWLEINNGFTYIYSYLPHQTDSTNHVPWTPAPHATTEVKIKLKDKPHCIVRGTYIEFGEARYWEQNNIYSAFYTELPSKAYSLYNAGIGTDFVNPETGKVICSLYVNCTNLLNLAYAGHLNLAQYFLSYNGNTATVTDPSQGIYNMGRNVGIKVLFPIGSSNVSGAKKTMDKD